MAEYWKSTPKYFCDHCQVYVRDTKIERTNHEASAKHQRHLKHFLRNIHAKNETEERNRERARQEINRLNGVAPSSSSGATAAAESGSATQRRVHYAQREGGAPVLSEAERKKHVEQLAELGVAIPDQFRGDMAMAGEWTVTAERVIRRRVGGAGVEAEDGSPGTAGGRKRTQTEEEKEEDEAMRGLFKRPKGGRWGRGTKKVGDEDDDDGDLDRLLGQAVSGVRAANQEDDGAVDVEKEEGIKIEENDDVGVEQEVKQEGGIKKEEDAEDRDAGRPELGGDAVIKPDPDGANQGLADVPIREEEEAGETKAKGGAIPSGVVFKKRKAKPVRQK